MTNNPANPNPGVTCIQVDGLTIVSIKPFSPGDALFALIGGVIFMGIGFCMFYFNHAPMMFILPALGCMFLFAVLVPSYMMFFTADIFVLSADSLEKRWNCKPFYRRSHIPRAEIQSIRADKRVVHTQKGGTRTKTFLELTKTNGKTIPLINGGEMSRLRLAADYLNKALFPQYVPQPPPDQTDPLMMSGRTIKINPVGIAVASAAVIAMFLVPFSLFMIFGHGKTNSTVSPVVTQPPAIGSSGSPISPIPSPTLGSRPGVPHPLAADLITAWKKAGAQSGWMNPGGQIIISATGRRGQIAAFRFMHWTPGMLSQLPTPDQGFGLDLQGTNITDSDLKDLAGFIQLEELNLSGTHVSGIGLTDLASLPFLQSLKLRASRLTDAGMQAVAGLAQLQMLDLAGTHITDAGVSDLSDLAQLRSLDIANTRVTDAGLKNLAGLTQLQFLSMNNTHITDSGLQALSGLTQLHVLWLDHTLVADTGLQELADLTQLQTLSVRNTAVTSAGVAELTIALPKLRVIH